MSLVAGPWRHPSPLIGPFKVRCRGEGLILLGFFGADADIRKFGGSGLCFFFLFYMIFLKVRLPIIILVVVSIRLMSENFINWFVTSRGQSWKGNLFLTVLLYDFWCTAGSRGNCGGMPLIPEVRNSQHHQLESLFNQVHRFQPEMVAARHKNLWTRTTRGYKYQKNPRSIPRASETSHEE